MVGFRGLGWRMWVLSCALAMIAAASIALAQNIVTSSVIVPAEVQVGPLTLTGLVHVTASCPMIPGDPCRFRVNLANMHGDGYRATGAFSTSATSMEVAGGWQVEFEHTFDWVAAMSQNFLPQDPCRLGFIILLDEDRRIVEVTVFNDD
jgi:hypothetical protein